MKVNVDFSIFIEKEGAFGNITGPLEVVAMPQVGDSISFLFSGRGGAFESLGDFSGILKVVNRVISANKVDDLLGLALTDVVVSTKEDAIKLAQYFESSFDLFSVMYSDEEN